jgi:hypothetical protein
VPLTVWGSPPEANRSLTVAARFGGTGFRLSRPLAGDFFTPSDGSRLGNSR